jgi:hypothetical protein
MVEKSDDVTKFKNLTLLRINIFWNIVSGILDLRHHLIVLIGLEE